MFSDPKKNIEQFALLPGMRVADLGSGSGFYCLAAARAVTDSGRVYGIDLQKDLLTRLKNNAQKEGILNIEVIWGDVEVVGGTKLGDHLLDAVIISNLLFQVKNKAEVVKEAKRILKPQGRVLMVDWSESFGGLGPRPEDVVTADAVKKLFADEGFGFDKEINAGAHHYGLVFKRKK